MMSLLRHSSARLFSLWCRLSFCSGWTMLKQCWLALHSIWSSGCSRWWFSAARLVFSASRYDRITPLLSQFHWLTVPERIELKLSVLVYRCLHHTASPYLAEELHQSSAVEARQRLRSASTSYRLLSDATVFQPTEIKLIRSLLPDCGILCRWTSCRLRHWLLLGKVWRPYFSVVLFPNFLYSACAVTLSFRTL